MKHKILQIVKEWNMEESEVRQIHDSVWEIGEQAVLKIYKDVNKLKRNINMLIQLENLGIPVGGIIPTKNDKYYTKDDEYYYILTRKLHGIR